MVLLRLLFLYCNGTALLRFEETSNLPAHGICGTGDGASDSLDSGKGLRLVGKVDAKSDRDAGALRVHRIHWDEDSSVRLRDAVHDEIARLAAFLALRPIVP